MNIKEIEDKYIEMQMQPQFKKDIAQILQKYFWMGFNCEQKDARLAQKDLFMWLFSDYVISKDLLDDLFQVENPDKMFCDLCGVDHEVEGSDHFDKKNLWSVSYARNNK